MMALAWRNLWRQPRRTLLTTSAIAFACVVMVSLLALQLGTYASMKDNSLNLFDGYAQVQRPGYLGNPDIRKSFSGSTALVRKIRDIPGVGAVTARARTYALLSRDSRSLAAMIVGVQPETEKRVSRIASTVTSGRYLHDGNPAEIVLGDILARNLDVKVGDPVTLLGMGRDGSVAADILTVVGLFSSGLKDLDRQTAEVPLQRFQTDFAMGGAIHALVISGRSLSAVEHALPAIRHIVAPAGLKVCGWGELEPGLKDAIRLDASTSTLWYVALIVVVVAILLNTVLMAVLERTREFGILLALGMRPGVAGRMVWLEILLLLSLGLAAGIGLGAALVGWFSVHGLVLPGAEGVFARWGLPERIFPELSFVSLFFAPGVMAVCTAVAGIYPFLRIRRLEPVAAMRAV